MENGNESDGRQYLEQVLAELKRREIRLSELDALIARLDFDLHQISTSGLGGAPGALLAGDSNAIRSVEAYRKVKRRELQVFKDERHSVLEDIRRAHERKRMIEEELQG